MKKKSFFIIIFIYCISFVYADNLIIKELHISDESPYLSEKMYSSIGEVIYLSLKIPNSIILNSTVFEEKISGEKWNKKIGELVTICQLSSMQLNIPEELYTNNYNKKFFYNHTKKRLKNFDTMKIDEVNYFEFYIFDDNLCCIINFFTDAVEYQEEEKQFLNIIQSLNFPYSRIGIMNDSKVRIRSTPSLNSNILGMLKKGENILIIGRSEEKTIIDENENYWYKIQYNNNQYGWVYGAYVDIKY